jgi:hypothetical protein
LRGGFAEHFNLFFVEEAGLHGLNYENTLEDAAIDEGNSEEGLVGVFASFAKIFEARVSVGLLNCYRTDLLRHQAGEAFVDGHAELADAFGAKADRGSEDQVGAVRLKQVGGADFGLKALGDEGDDVHQSFGGLAFRGGKGRDFVEGEDVSIGAAGT